MLNCAYIICSKVCQCIVHRLTAADGTVVTFTLTPFSLVTHPLSAKKFQMASTATLYFFFIRFVSYCG